MFGLLTRPIHGGKIYRNMADYTRMIGEDLSLMEINTSHFIPMKNTKGTSGLKLCGRVAIPRNDRGESLMELILSRSLVKLLWYSNKSETLTANVAINFAKKGIHVQIHRIRDEVLNLYQMRAQYLPRYNNAYLSNNVVNDYINRYLSQMDFPIHELTVRGKNVLDHSEIEYFKFLLTTPQMREIIYYNKNYERRDQDR